MRKAKREAVFMRRLLWTALIAAVIGIAALFFAQDLEKQSKEVKIYFFKSGKLAVVKRLPGEKADPYNFAIEQLLQGPIREEKDSGYYTQIPENTRVRVIYREGRTVNADFTKELEMYGGGTTKVYGSLAQIVYTLTSLKGVKDVQILINGRREIALGSEGLIIDKPLRRKDVSP